MYSRLLIIFGESNQLSRTLQFTSQNSLNPISSTQNKSYQQRLSVVKRGIFQTKQQAKRLRREKRPSRKGADPRSLFLVVAPVRTPQYIILQKPQMTLMMQRGIAQ